MNDILNNIKNYNYKKFLLPAILIIIYLIGFIFLYNLINNKENNSNNEITFVEEIETEPVQEQSFIYVDIKGYVNKPGVYKIDSNSRVIDAINEAKGLKKGANTRFINLSKSLKDGDVIVIYSNDEIKKAEKKDTIVVETPCICEEVKNNACYEDNDVKEETGKININTANIEELITLTGIGESKANSIIEYRNTNGLFSKIEDIVNVDGISETIFSKIKENITV